MPASDYDNLKTSIHAKLKEREGINILKAWFLAMPFSAAQRDTVFDDLVTRLGIGDVDTSWSDAHQEHFNSLENLIKVGQMSDANKVEALAALRTVIVYETPEEI